MLRPPVGARHGGLRLKNPPRAEDLVEVRRSEEVFCILRIFLHGVTGDLLQRAMGRNINNERKRQMIDHFYVARLVL